MKKYILVAKYKKYCGILSFHKVQEILHFLDDDPGSEVQIYDNKNDALRVKENILSKKFQFLDLRYWSGATKKNIDVYVKEKE